jgi:hypothetical protein
MKRLLKGILLFTLCLGVSMMTGCTGQPPPGPAPAGPAGPTPPPPPPPPDTEEAPIRVKNGSVRIELPYGDSDWEETGGEWNQKKGSRRGAKLDITIAYSGGTCTSQTVAADRIAFVYDDQTKDPPLVSVRLNGGKVKVKGSKGLYKDKVNPDKVIVYPDPNGPAEKFFITTIYIDNAKKPFCTFTDPKHLTHVLIVDFD